MRLSNSVIQKVVKIARQELGHRPNKPIEPIKPGYVKPKKPTHRKQELVFSKKEKRFFDNDHKSDDFAIGDGDDFTLSDVMVWCGQHNQDPLTVKISAHQYSDEDCWPILSVITKWLDAEWDEKCRLEKIAKDLEFDSLCGEYEAQMANYNAALTIFHDRQRLLIGPIVDAVAESLENEMTKRRAPAKVVADWSEDFGYILKVDEKMLGEGRSHLPRNRTWMGFRIELGEVKGVVSAG